jgi:PAS domain S-box-containing protein
MIIAIGLALFFMSQQVNEALRQHDAADQIAESVFELNILTGDYLLHQEERAQLQWYIKHDSLSDYLIGLEFKNSEEQSILDKIRQDHEDSKGIFSQLIATSVEESDLREILAAQLPIKLQDMVSDASILSWAAQERLITAMQTFDLLVMIFAIVIAVTIVIYSILTINNIAKPIAKLHEGTEVIEKGNLDYRVGSPAKDEIGQLSRSFDKMTISLSKEINEHKKTEYNLRERVKELGCVYHIDKIFTTFGVSLNDALKQIVNIIPPALQFPKLACARIKFNNEEFKTKKFKETKWKISSDIMIKGRKNGKVEIFYTQKKPFSKEERDLVISVAKQITTFAERKKSEKALQRAAEEWKTTFDSITDMVSFHDKNFKILRVNKAFADYFKMKPEEIIGKTCYKLVHGTEKPWPTCPHKRTLDTKKPAREEFFEPHLGIHIEVSTSPVFNEKGEIIGSVHVIRDITERMRAEKLRQEFLSSASHQLKTPLTSILGYIELMGDKNLTKQQEKNIEIMLRNAKRLKELINKIMVLSRLRSPAVTLHLTEFDIKTIIEEVIKDQEVSAKVKKTKITTKIQKDLPSITADKTQLTTVVSNLISNAIKFTENGKIEIEAAKQNNNLIVKVKDTGLGISKKGIKEIFLPFVGERVMISKGTGLGLHICKRIVELHHGKIWAESKGAGKGSTFIFTIPIK